MVEHIRPTSSDSVFPPSAPAANPVFFRTYSRQTPHGRESWDEVCDRTLQGLIKLGKLTPEEAQLIDQQQRSLKALTSGRWLWIGGTPWMEMPANFSGGYNCTSTNVNDWRSFGLMMNLAMMGCGTGAVLEPHYIDQLPPIRNPLTVTIAAGVGRVPVDQRQAETIVTIEGHQVTIRVGDSRQGWVDSYQALLELSSDPRFSTPLTVAIDLGHVRPTGEALKGFGGVSNPIKLPGLYDRCAAILNKAVGRQLTSVECCLLIDEAAIVVVAGNVRRSAGIRQFAADDALGSAAKDNLWQQDEKGNWRIDPERDALRMANHTRVFHRKPTEQDLIEAVRKQFYSGEGAIQYAPEAIARGSADLLPHPELKQEFMEIYTSLGREEAKGWIRQHHPEIPDEELEHRLQRYGLNPCHAGDTLVSTNQGLVPIKELVGQAFQALVDLRAVGLDGVRLTDAIAFATGVQTTYVITLANGQQMRCTADHQHLTNHGWVATKDLTSDHHVYIQKGAGYFGKDTIPVEQAQRLGWCYGEGCNSRAIKSMTGVQYSKRLDQGGYGVRTQSPVLEKLVENLEIENKDILPTKFLTQSQEVLIGFLQGIFSADGTVEKGCRRIKLVNKSKALLQQIQLILLQLGILSTVRCTRKPGSRGVAYTTIDGTQKISADNGSYALCIDSFGYKLFHHLIGFPLSPAKAQKLVEGEAKPLPNYTTETIDSCFTAQVVTVEEFGEEPVYDLHVPLTHSFIANGCLTHNCGEIIMSNNHCNLAEVHLNQIDPSDHTAQELAFKSGALSVAVLLNHQFQEPRYQQSRLLDPIVGVSFTGLFDFFVHAFGTEWLQWWQAGRPETDQGKIFKSKEANYLNTWREIVEETVVDYCDRHGLKRPNRCTTVQPSGTKALLTGASPGWHPPKSQRFLRRITFRKNDPIALACLDYGYTVIPSQSDKDEDGNLLNDPFDPRCTEWLVEIPTAVSWADLPGADGVDISQFSALAQFDFYMQVQRHYTRHNTSATIELREPEVEPLAQAIYQSIVQGDGYMSAALLARFDDHQTFPRLPFEPISKEQYDRFQAEVLARRKTQNFFEALQQYDRGLVDEAGPAGCDSDKCLLPDLKQ